MCFEILFLCPAEGDQLLDRMGFARPFLVDVLAERIDERQERRGVEHLDLAAGPDVVDLEDVVGFRMVDEDDELRDIGRVELARVDGGRPHTDQVQRFVELPRDGEDADR